MPIIHTGPVGLTPSVRLPAFCCPEADSLSALSTIPRLALTIGPPPAGQHLCQITVTLNHQRLLPSREAASVLPFQLRRGSDAANNTALTDHHDCRRPIPCPQTHPALPMRFCVRRWISTCKPPPRSSPPASRAHVSPPAGSAHRGTTTSRPQGTHSLWTFQRPTTPYHDHERVPSRWNH
jgi:hypothetical protein